MEEIETPIEKIQEQMNEIAQEAHAQHAADNWIGRVALSSAVIAVCAAVAALLAGHHSNEAMIDQIQASNQWSYYQAKGVKANLLATKIDLYALQGHAATEADQTKLETYKKEQEEISKLATEKQESSERHLSAHNTMAKSVTFFQVAIAISAIAILIRRKKFWYTSLGFAFIGLFYFITAVTGFTSR
jgi:cytochrome b